MIESFRHKGLRRLFEGGDQRGVQLQWADKILLIVDAIDKTEYISQLNTPGLHSLSGARAGVWSVKVTGNWRITFEFEEGIAYNVDYEDYY